MRRKTAVLVLAANPKDTPPLRLDQEVREIQAGLRSGSRAFSIRQDWAVRARDIRRALLEHRPRIVHFSGHGTGTEGLVFEDDAGSSHVVGTSAIAGLFALFAEHVECVVLNACFSESQAKAIAPHVQCVVGMSRAISDHAAIEFAVGFYDAVAAGKPYDVAYRFGCNAIELAGWSEHLTPILIQKSVGTVQIASEDAKRHPTAITRSAEEPLTIQPLQALMASGWSMRAIMERVEELDYRNVRGLDSASEGSPAQWEAIAESNPDGYAFLVGTANNIVGYWHFEAIPSEMYQRAVEGTLEDGELSVDNITILCAPGELDVYFIIFVVDKHHRGFRANRLLFDAFLDRLEQLAAAGIIVNKVCANAFTPEGVAMCRSVGMRFIGPHARNGLIYELDLRQPNAALRTRSELRSAYLKLAAE